MRMLALAFLVLAAAAPPAAAPGILKKGQRVAVVGDSITEQKLYSRYVEMYLLACLPELDLRVVQLGWSGERAPGFAARMDHDLLPWKPDVVTTCYGMNDGSYRPYEEKIGQAYRDAMAGIVARLKKAGVAVVVGSPGCVDPDAFKSNSVKGDVYNENLAKLRDHARALAEAEGQPFADVHGAMISMLGKSKAALGAKYLPCGGDGFHPSAPGQLAMAYAFLKGMKLDGDLGTITVDLKGSSTAAGGHKVVGGDAGKAEVESAAYPFVPANDARSVLPHLPFLAELSRLTLTVKNLDAPKAAVTWGGATKSFSREELEKGINLAEAFLDNPFVENFRKAEARAAAKQAYETVLLKQLVNSFPRLNDAMGKDAELAKALEDLRARGFEALERMHASVRAALPPVRHSISVAPEK
jgi:lysophospholipase L1-like esterase